MKEAAEHSVDRFNKDELVERTEFNTTEPVGGVAYTYTAYARGLMATQYRVSRNQTKYICSIVCFATNCVAEGPR